MAKIRLTVEPFDGKTKTINLPQDWDEMDPAERNEYLEDEAQSFALSSITYGGAVIE